MCVYCVVAIHKTLSSILQLGNIQFVQDKTSEQATLPDNTGNHSDVCSLHCQIVLSHLLFSFKWHIMH